MIPSLHTTARTTSLRGEFGRLMAHIRVAQVTEEAAYAQNRRTGEDAGSLTDVADKSWSYAYVSSDEIKEIEPESEIDYSYLEIAALLRGLLCADLFERDYFADRAAEKRAELGQRHRLECSDISDALTFLLRQDWLPTDDPEALEIRPPVAPA